MRHRSGGGDGPVRRQDGWNMRPVGVFAHFVVLCIAGSALAACATTQTAPGVAGIGSTTSTTAPASAPSAFSVHAQLQFARCMRRHGVPQFPDPGAHGGFLGALARAQSQQHLNLHSPTFRAALRSCRKYEPAAHLSPAQRAAQNASGIAYSQCMRRHGVPSFPDPRPGPIGGEVIDLRPAHIDPTSPAYVAAERACRHIIPSGK